MGSGLRSIAAGTLSPFGDQACQTWQEECSFYWQDTCSSRFTRHTG